MRSVHISPMHFSGMLANSGGPLSQPWPPGEAVRLGPPFASGRFASLQNLAGGELRPGFRKVQSFRRALRVVADNVVALPERPVAAATFVRPSAPLITLPSSGARLVRDMRQSVGKGRGVHFESPIAPPHSRLVFADTVHAWQPSRANRFLPALSTLALFVILGAIAFALLRHLLPIARIYWLNLAQALTLP